MKKFLTLLLCISMILSLMPTVFATETEHTEPATAETTVATEATTSTTETTAATTEATTAPTTEPTTAPTTEATEETTEATTEPAEPGEGNRFAMVTMLDGSKVEVGDTVYIKPGQTIYKQASEDAEHYTLSMATFRITILEMIADEKTGSVTWYKFEYQPENVLEWIGNQFFKEYQYVKVSSTSVTEPDENDCDCGSTSDNLSDHADTCARKKYVLSLIQKDGDFKTAEEIFEDWDDFDEKTKNDILDLLYTMNPELSQDLEAMIEGTAAVILNDFAKLENVYAQLPESASYEECEAFYRQMMDTYSKAFDNDVTIVSGEEMQKIDAAFGELEQKLYYEYGYCEIQDTVMPISTILSGGSTDSMGSVENSLILDKNVSEGTDSDFLLTLESYVTGVSQDYQQPVDLVLVLDQSASMYAPMGVSVGLNNKKLFAESNANIERYTLTGEANTLKLELNEETLEKASQLGYFVAQSRSGGWEYCTNQDHSDDSKPESKHDEKCKTMDWFVVQYVEEDAKPWKFYRICATACPHNDSYNNKTYVTRCVETDDIAKYNFYFYKSQTGALFDGINAFAEALYNESKSNSVNHRLAIAGFAGYDLRGEDNYRNNSDDHMPDRPGTCIYNGGTKVPYNNTYKPQTTIYTSTITSDEYKSALMSFKNDYSNIQAALKAVKTDYYGTRQDVGFDMAKNILKNAEKLADDVEGVERKKIVVMFTDGEPSGPEKSDVVAKAAELKKETDAEVYTICTSTLAADKREFLDASSSDYPDATAEFGGADSTIKKGEKISDPKYAKTAVSAEDLVKQFLSIVEDVGGAYIQLGKETILQDALTDDFVLPDALVEALEQASTSGNTILQNTIKKYIKVYTADYDGTKFGDPTPFDDATIEIQKNSKTQYSVIRVTNFDYSENFVSENGRGENNFYGRKLIVEIPINIAEGSLGGNNLFTNVQADSAIYRNDTEKLKEFPVPYVDVPTAVTVTKNVAGAKADETKLFTFTGSKTEISGWVKDSADTHYLKATTVEQNLSFDLKHNENEEIQNLYVGSTLTISETLNDHYKAEIKVYKANGTTEITPTVNTDGSLTVTVEPGMKIVYTNTCLLTDLTIEKQGLETIDENQSTVFKVTGDNDFEIEVVILGNQSITIKDIPAGEYKVEELTDWSWRYTTDDEEQTVTAEYDKTNKVTFTNSRNENKWLSGDAYCRNWWGKNTADKS